jgi:hypothetical protein
MDNKAMQAKIAPQFSLIAIVGETRTMKTATAIIIGLVALGSGCSTQTSPKTSSFITETSPSLGKMYFVCTTFKETYGRWPTSTPEVVAFLTTDFTNVVSNLETGYSDAQYSVEKSGWLTIKTPDSTISFK